MISIIIPARNEEVHLSKTLSYLKECAPDDTEFIVAEGGSEDRTVEIARSRALVVHGGDCTRAALMNAEARVARGDVCSFCTPILFRPRILCF